MNNVEFGYTPQNLRKLREQYKLTQQDVADMTDTIHGRTVAKWEKELGEQSHADMPYTKWMMLLAKLERDQK